MSQDDFDELTNIYPSPAKAVQGKSDFVDPSLVVGRSILVSDEELRVWIKALRHHIGWSTEKMANACGLRKQSLRNLEQTGRPSGPTLKVLDRLAQDLGFPVHSAIAVRPIKEE